MSQAQDRISENKAVQALKSKKASRLSPQIKNEKRKIVPVKTKTVSSFNTGFIRKHPGEAYGALFLILNFTGIPFGGRTFLFAQYRVSSSPEGSG